MKKHVLLIPVVLSSLLLGCQTAGEKENVGTVIGAVSGTIIGAQFGHGAGRVVGAGIGALVGGFLGNAIGRSADQSDVREANRAFNKAARSPVGQTVYWHNKRTGNWGTYRPVRDGHSGHGKYCREFVTTATVNGKTERVYGTACRQPNGTWYAI